MSMPQIGTSSIPQVGVGVVCRWRYMNSMQTYLSAEHEITVGHLTFSYHFWC